MINKIHKNLIKRKEEFLTAAPFPHLILDDFFTKNFFKELVKILNSQNYDKKSITFNSTVENEKKIFLNQNIPIIQKIAVKLSEPSWLNVLKEVSDIDDIVAPDLKFGSLSNFHEMSRNGILGSHVDHSSHPITGSKHVMNIIIYLSNDWQSLYGGNTLFYNYNGKKVIKKINYVPNRAVLFLHTPYSFHGVDKILDTRDEKRQSFYIDYYSNKNSPYSGFNLNFPNKYFHHGTTFILPKLSDYFKIKNLKYTGTLIKYNFNKMFY